MENHIFWSRYRVRVSSSRPHIPTKKFREYSPPPPPRVQGPHRYEHSLSWFGEGESTFVLPECEVLSPYKKLIFSLKKITVNILTSDTVLVKGPSNSYDVHPSQHFFGSHVTFGVTQWKPGVPNPNTSNENWFVMGKTIKQVQKYNSFWYLPKDDTCSKMSSNSNLRFLSSSSDVGFEFSFSAIAWNGNKMKRS